ncbi:Hypothetical protein, putative [Bodo saltans]|uniref:Uncharacterized protein n=1 Tax=Bodo saltans TaxID=75058 RepID=A0A0S4JEJ3_BODSA|nr:Hypothetical protein, putative [Bodo saltans]|eukprot:CUG87840.1 Hypothetical protein, putative [Bodo saltans]
MFTEDKLTSSITHPFGRVGGTITYTPTLLHDTYMVHALIVSLDSTPAAAEQLHLGRMHVRDQEGSDIQRPSHKKKKEEVPSNKASAHPIVTHYLGTALWSSSKTHAVEHHVMGSPNSSYVGRVLVREVLLSEDKEWMLLRGPLGMNPSTVGCILWRRQRSGKL